MDLAVQNRELANILLGYTVDVLLNHLEFFAKSGKIHSIHTKISLNLMKNG